MSTTTRLTARAARLVLLAGLDPTAAVDEAASKIAAAPAARRFALRLLSGLSRDGLRRMAGGAA